ncbi:MAG: hypothetical protein AAGI70_07745 [Pseudomonadota bacterium]
MRLLAIILMASLAAPVTAEAVTFRYTIEDGTFVDGGTFSGFFEFDTVANLITNHELTVSGGNTTLFPALTYSGPEVRPSGTVIGVLPNVELWNFGNRFGPRNLTLAFLDGGGSVGSPNHLRSGIDFSLVTGFGAGELLFPPFVNRRITGGTATASVAAIPLPAAATMLLSALGFLGTFRLWSRRRPAP